MVRPVTLIEGLGRARGESTETKLIKLTVPRTSDDAISKKCDIRL